MEMETTPTGPINSNSPKEIQQDAIQRLIKRFGPKNLPEHLAHLDFKFADVIRRALAGLTDKSL